MLAFWSEHLGFSDQILYLFRTGITEQAFASSFQRTLLERMAPEQDRVEQGAAMSRAKRPRLLGTKRLLSLRMRHGHLELSHLSMVVWLRHVSCGYAFRSVRSKHT